MPFQGVQKSVAPQVWRSYLELEAHKMKQDRVVYLDFLRVIAAIAVILVHVASRHWYVTPVDTYEWRIMNIYGSFVRWCVPVFLMISGVFFLDTTKIISKKDIYFKYIKKIVITLIFWGMFYGLTTLIMGAILRKEAFDLNDVFELFFRIMMGVSWYHLWYLYMIIGVYMLIPIFRTFIANAKRRDIEYILILFFLFGQLLPGINKILSASNADFSINFSVVELTGYIGYVFAGYYFHQYEITKRLKYSIYLLGLLSIGLTMMMTEKVSLSAGSGQDVFYGYLFPTTMFEAYAVFLLVKDIFNSIRCSSKVQKLLAYGSSCSFGVYLIHDFLIQVAYKIGMTPLMMNPIFAIPLMTLVIFMGSMLAIMVMKKIQFINRNIL